MDNVTQFFDSKKDALPFNIQQGSKVVDLYVEGNINNDVELTWQNGVVMTFPENGGMTINAKVRFDQSAIVTGTTFTRLIVSVQK